MNVFLGIDAGTTSIKAALFDVTGRCLGIGREEYSLQTPAEDRVELDAEVYWRACVRATRTALEQAEVQPAEVRGIGVSSQGETVMPIGRDGAPVGPAIVWLDNRAAEEAEFFASQLDLDWLYRITGLTEIVPTWTACKLLWLKRHQPEQFAAAHKFLLVTDWIAFRLTGQYVTEGAVSSSTMLYDIVADGWRDELLELAGVSRAQLAEPRQAGKVIGRLTAAAAEALGLLPGTPVTLCGMDQCAGSVGAGNIAPGMVSETTGAALAVQASIRQFNLERRFNLPVLRHSAPGLYLICPFAPTGGMTLKWLRDVFGEVELAQAQASGQDAYDLLCASAGQVEPGCGGLLMLPHLTGASSPEYNPYARGVFYGFTLYHQKAHFIRAVLEAVAYLLRRNLELMSSAGLEFYEVRSMGGGARSSLWRQIKADVCNLPVVSMMESETALLGNAMLAAVAVGDFADLQQAAASMVRLAERLQPIPANVETYEQAYQRYCRLNEILDPVFRAHFARQEA